MKTMYWTVIATIAVSSSAVIAQTPARKVRPIPEVVLAPVTGPSKLTRSQLLSRLRLSPQKVVATPPTSPASATPTPTPAPAEMPTIVERETLTVDLMEAGASRLYFSNVGVSGAADGKTHIGMPEGGQWGVTFRGSGNAYAVDCFLFTPNTDVSYLIRLREGPTTFRDIDGVAPLFENHVVVTVPRAGAGNEVRVIFESPVVRGVLTAAFMSCKILELT